MNQPTEEMLHIPVRATYRVTDGMITQTAAEYADISADDFARFLLKGLGIEGAPES